MHGRAFSAPAWVPKQVESVDCRMIGERRPVSPHADRVEDCERDPECEREAAGLTRRRRRGPCLRGHDPMPRKSLAMWPLRKAYQTVNASKTVSHLRVLAYSESGGCRRQRNQ